MIPVSLSLENFLSYGEQVPPLDFTQFQVACLAGDNGHGKSALLDAITYALWGEARKSSHERKPDEGLLRIGASEMRVEFCFDLDGERFRVLRSYRRSKRGVPQLELQIYDAARDTFRTLSEGESLRRTQERIDQLLCMDYETFINSAFIVQGRSDEFTRHSARQRKQILAEILGLSRYERLQERARSRYQERDQQVREAQRRLTDLDAELTKKPQYEADLQQVGARFAELAETLAADEARLETLGRERGEGERLAERLAGMEEERRRDEARLAELEKERQHLDAQQRRDGEILAESERIERDFQEYQQRRTESGEQEEKRRRRRELDAEVSDLVARITQARHEVEQRREKWSALFEDLERRLAEYRALLEREQTIEARRAHLEAARQEDRALEQERARHEQLERQRQTLEHQIELERQTLENRRQNLEERQAPLRDRQQEWQGQKERARHLQEAIEVMRRQARERDHLREQGGSLRARIDALQTQLRRQQEELEQAREKVHILRSAGEQASCPLCGSQLDAEHRGQLGAELARQEEAHNEGLARRQRELAELEEQLRTMRARYQALEKETATLEERQRELAELQARGEQVRAEGQELEKLADEVALIGRQLTQKDYAPQERQRAEEIAGELRQLDYRPEGHAELRARIDALHSVEAEYARLRHAREQTESLGADLEEARQKRDLARQYLDEKLYAHKEQEQLAALHRHIEDLGYDAEAHERLRRRIDELSDAVALRERLQAARQRHESGAAALDKLARESQALSGRLEQMLEQQNVLQERAAALEGAAGRCEELAGKLAHSRAERDRLLERKGALENLCARCAELDRERQHVRAALEGAEREKWVYAQLDRAFGKDGIQALIIENTIPEIEREANAILARLTGNRIQVSIESLRDLRGGGTRETLDITIADEVGERSYDLYSGGEAFRTNFALRIALSKVLALRSGTQLRTLIIDEGFGTQDSQGLEQLIEAIQEISRDFDKVLVVTHLPQLRNAFPVQIQVTKYPDIGSRFEIVHDA